MDQNIYDALIKIGYKHTDAAKLCEKFTELVQHASLHADREDYESLKSAFLFAADVHKNQRRKSGGEPFLFHPLAVASILSRTSSVSLYLIEAGLLHDTMEDSRGAEYVVSYEDIASKFGTEVANLVEAVTDIDARETELNREDVDDLSKEKLIQEICNNPEALLLKAADRIHNLRTIQSFSYEKKVQKVEHTRQILIPAAKSIHAFRIAEILEELCFKIEQANVYNTLKSRYHHLLEENRNALLQDEKYIKSLLTSSKNKSYEEITKYVFFSRSIFSIWNVMHRNVKNFNIDPAPKLNKRVALKDIYILIKDNYQSKDVTKPFFNLYKEILNVPTASLLTIIGVRKDLMSEELFFLAEDRSGVRYRVFVERESEYEKRLHGFLSDKDDDEYQKSKLNLQTAIHPEKMIRIFKRDGSPLLVPDMSTILDVAFQIHAEVGLCAKYGLLNHSKEQMPLYTRVFEGDYVNIISDSEQKKRHASIRWTEWVNTPKNRRTLCRYLEKNIESASARDLSEVYYLDRYNKKHKKRIQTGATVLDLAFQINPNIALHLTAVYINASSTPIRFDRRIGYGNVYRFVWNIKNDDIPRLQWFSFLKTDIAKASLISYFEKKSSKSSIL